MTDDELGAQVRKVGRQVARGLLTHDEWVGKLCELTLRAMQDDVWHDNGWDVDSGQHDHSLCEDRDDSCSGRMFHSVEMMSLCEHHLLALNS